mmetsp:Transcript_23996/g.67235  ORF Transcript_23996/g.67235 Transcript_23996/m.67235 type:complete len:286 (-) Transcript_23996:381-1238(-)
MAEQVHLLLGGNFGDLPHQPLQLLPEARRHAALGGALGALSAVGRLQGDPVLVERAGAERVGVAVRVLGVVGRGQRDEALGIIHEAAPAVVDHHFVGLDVRGPHPGEVAEDGHVVVQEDDLVEVPGKPEVGHVEPAHVKGRVVFVVVDVREGRLHGPLRAARAEAVRAEIVLGLRPQPDGGNAVLHQLALDVGHGIHLHVDVDPVVDAVAAAHVVGHKVDDHVPEGLGAVLRNGEHLGPHGLRAVGEHDGVHLPVRGAEPREGRGLLAPLRRARGRLCCGGGGGL